MTIDRDELMRFPIPEIRQRIAPREVIFYALSVGVGQDALDLRQLDFVDHHRSLRVLPSMASVLGHPGFWMADQRTGIDVVKLVHGEEGFVIHRPLPVEGEVIGRSRVTALVDRGVDRGALMYTERQIFDAEGTLLATTTATIVLRGDGGFGGTGDVNEPGRVVHTPPDTPPDVIIDLPTRPEQALLYRLNGDDNPLHADPGTAAAAGFTRPILHGLCTLGVVTHALLRGVANYDAVALRQLNLRFSSPVLPGETIRTEIWRNGAFRARVLERDVVVVNSGRAVFARAGSVAST